VFVVVVFRVKMMKILMVLMLRKTLIGMMTRTLSFQDKTSMSILEDGCHIFVEVS
jgi:hypothetical protein